MTLLIKSFWLVLASVLCIGFLALGFVGIPYHPISVQKPISLDHLEKT